MSDITRTHSRMADENRQKLRTILDDEFDGDQHRLAAAITELIPLEERQKVTAEVIRRALRGTRQHTVNVQYMTRFVVDRTHPEPAPVRQLALVAPPSGDAEPLVVQHMNLGLALAWSSRLAQLTMSQLSATPPQVEAARRVLGLLHVDIPDPARLAATPPDPAVSS